MDIFKINFDDLSPEQQAYFKSPAFQNLSPSAKISIARERLTPKPNSEQIELRRQQEDAGRRQVFEDRAKAEEMRQATVRAYQAERKRKFLN